MREIVRKIQWDLDWLDNYPTCEQEKSRILHRLDLYLEMIEIYKNNIVDSIPTILNTDISHLELTLRAHNALKKASIHKFEELIKLNEHELNRIKGLGVKACSEIKYRLAEFGLHLKV